MDSKKILIVDKEPKNLQILKESLENSNFKVVVAENGRTAFIKIREEKPNLMISEVDLPDFDGFRLLDKLQEDSVGATLPIVFLTNRRNLDDRVKSLRAGVKDFMIKPLHVKEVIARVKMILNRIERVQIDEGEGDRKIIGRLEEQGVEELLESFGAERRTGVLTLYDKNNRNGEIYFRGGAIVNARLGNFKAEKAVYQMLPWTRGHYIMTLKDFQVKEEITVSNLGLLLQGFKHMQTRQALEAKLPSLDTVFKKTEVFKQILKKKSVNTDAEKFIELFDGKRTVYEIIAESSYDDLKSLERIIKLHEQGFIRTNGQTEQNNLAEATPPPVENELPQPAVEPRAQPASGHTAMTTEDEIQLLREQEARELAEELQMISEAKNLHPEEDTPSADKDEISFSASITDTTDEPAATVPKNDKQNADAGPSTPAEPDDNVSFTHDFTREPDPETQTGDPFELKEPFDLKYLSELPIHTEAQPEAQKSAPTPEPDEEAASIPDIAAEPAVTEPEPISTNGLPSQEPATTSDTTEPAADLPLGMLFENRDLQEGHLVFIAPDETTRKAVLTTLCGRRVKTVTGKSGESFELSTLATKDQKRVDVFGVAMDRNLMPMIQTLNKNLLGYVFLIDGSKTSNMGYWGYLMNTITSNYPAPHIVAVFRSKDPAVPLDLIRHALNLPSDEQIVEVDASRLESVKHVLGQLQPPPYRQDASGDANPHSSP